MANRLDEILTAKRAHVAARKAAVSSADLAAQAAAAAPPRGFRAALDAKAAAGGYALIAEIKKASPSKGLIRADFDPPAHARAYAAGGATCLSVLTDRPYFQGDDADLAAARAACDLPVLRKDFMIDPWQCLEARALGADAILIIVAALDDAAMAEIEDAAVAAGMDVLVEVHDEAEMARALALRSRLIGINNRDLRDFTVDIARSERLAGVASQGCTLVAESGLGSKRDLDRLASTGVTSFLVGESLMRMPDVTQATRLLLEGA